MADIRLNIQFTGLMLPDCIVPDDYTPEQLLSEVIEHLELPRTTHDGGAVNYSLVQTNRHLNLPEGRSIAESGVRDGDTLLIMSSHIEIHLQILDLNRTELVIFPNEISIGEMIDFIVARYRLPKRDKKLEERKIYVLFSGTVGKALHEGMTLTQAGIPFRDTIILSTKEIPGGYALPIPKRTTIDKFKRAVSARLRGAATYLKQIKARSGSRLDPVDCTVFAPPVVQQGGECLIQVLLHRPGQDNFLIEVVREFDKDTTRRGFKRLEMNIARGSRITVHFTMAGVEISDPIQSIMWKGTADIVFFDAKIPMGHRLGDVIGTVRISCNQIPVGHIKFKLTVVGEEQEYRDPMPVGLACTYRKAFVSYAWQDRPEVLKRVQMLSVLRIKLFQDILSLKPGVHWEKQIYRSIEESDLFLLFWSSAAKNSEWVLKEIRYALKIKGGDDLLPPEIIPIPIEGPPPVPPPKELAHLHFNDYILYLIASP